MQLFQRYTEALWNLNYFLYDLLDDLNLLPGAVSCQVLVQAATNMTNNSQIWLRAIFKYNINLRVLQQYEEQRMERVSLLLLLERLL